MFLCAVQYLQNEIDIGYDTNTYISIDIYIRYIKRALKASFDILTSEHLCE